MTYEFMEGWGNMGAWGGMAFGGLMMLFWFALLVGLIVLIVKWLGGTSRRSTGRDALDTLKHRFARGEIDTAEFEERSRELRAAE
jgi:putative membrane protein